ncbi:MAG: hypothetical protein AAGD10_14735 [Myxococcota bacterium]
MKRLLLTLAGFAVACGDVDVVEIQPNLGLVSGELLIQDDPQAVSPCGALLGGDVILTAFSTLDPPPPVGTGEPVVFRVVPEEAWLQGPGPIFTAGFAIPSLPTGSYLLSGFVDVDRNFSPGLGLLAQPTGGDLLGGRVDPSGDLIPVEVMAGEEVPGVVLSFGRSVPLEPPAFVFSPPGLPVPTSSAAAVVLQASPQMRGPIQHRPECAGFFVQATAEDRNMDGQPDPLPRVLLSGVGEGDEVGVLIEASIDTSSFAQALATNGFAIVPSLRIRVPPFGARTRPDGSLQPIAPPPPGAYAITLVTGTSQNWTVPNVLDTIDPPPDGTSTQARPLILQ